MFLQVSIVYVLKSTSHITQAFNPHILISKNSKMATGGHLEYFKSKLRIDIRFKLSDLKTLYSHVSH